MYVSASQLDHFIDFITSEQIIIRKEKSSTQCGKKGHYLEICHHNHSHTCHRCSRLTSVVAEIERVVQKVGGTTDTKEGLAFVTLQSKQCINSWKSHSLRSTNLDESRLDVIDELDETSVLLVLDWAMKYLPKKFRESQTDWFGKRGLPWHITVATRKGNDGKIEMMTFVHLFETCNQDSSAVLVILNDVFRRLEDVMPHLKFIYLRQDNAGRYHCALTLVTASKVDQSR